MAFHTTHLLFHFCTFTFPVLEVPLELFDPSLNFISRGRGRLSIAPTSFLLPPFGEFILGHGCDGRGCVEVLRFVVEGTFLLRLGFSIR